MPMSAFIEEVIVVPGGGEAQKRPEPVSCLWDQFFQTAAALPRGAALTCPQRDLNPLSMI
jgi:hypothetical protein